MKSVARKHNVTGVPGLAIGSTKNDRGHVLKRYSTNFIDENEKPVNQSFYFGKNKSQFEAFVGACSFLKDNGIIKLSRKALTDIYKGLDHETLIANEGDTK